MELTNQLATLQDEVKLLKGEIKSILKEIRTAVLSRDNPFSVGVEGVQMPRDKGDASSVAQEPALPATEPKPIEPAPVGPAPIVPAPITPAPITPAPITPAPITPAPMAPTPMAPTFQVPATPQPTPASQIGFPQPTIVIQGGAQPGPAWAGSVPSSEPAPAPFTPSAAPKPLAPPLKEPDPIAPKADQAGPAKNAQRAAEAEDDQPEEAEDDELPDNEPIPIRPGRQQDEPVPDKAAPVRQQPSWSLPTIAGLAVWAEDALVALGPRRFQFVLELATFAELLSPDAREVLGSLMDADALSHEDERPLNVNECLVLLRQLEAIVHGEKVIKLPRRRGIRHRRIR